MPAIMQNASLRLITTTVVGLVATSLLAIVSGQTPTTIALTGARVIDGTGAAPIEAATVVINNGSIQAVGRSGAVQIPANVTRVDVSGKTIIPGLINAHGHLSIGDEALPPGDQIVSQLRLYADYGITTVHSLGDDGIESVKVRDSQTDATRDGARSYVSGPSLTQLLRGKTIEDARQLVDLQADRKVDIIKFHVDGAPGAANRLAPEMYRAIIDQAHKRSLRTAAHVYYLADAKGLVDAGVDVLAHSIRDQDVDTALVAELKRRAIPYIPTLTRDLSVFVYETTPAFFNEPFFMRRIDAYRKHVEQVKDPALQEKTRNSKEAQGIKQALQQAQRNLKRLSDDRVPIAMGTDTGAGVGRWQGYFEHVELELMAQSGMTPMQILVSATGGAARAMKLDARLGTLQTGKAADFVVLNANPLDDIKNTREIHSVWIGGRRLETTSKSH